MKFKVPQVTIKKKKKKTYRIHNDSVQTLMAFIHKKHQFRKQRHTGQKNISEVVEAD